jgi:hypothetical protein
MSGFQTSMVVASLVAVAATFAALLVGRGANATEGPVAV